MRHLLLLTFLTCALQAHPDRVETALKFHFATGGHPPKDGQWEDMSHQAKARLHGAPMLKDLGPAQALVLNGGTDWLEIAPSLQEAQPLLPGRECTVMAWVWLDDTRNDGGICGFIQDNGAYEKGWLLGYHGTRFSWALAGKREGEPNGGLTYLRSQSTLEKSRWHHVTGTYDGKEMRLYVDGKLDSTSTNQWGDIAYPERGRLTLAAFADDNELNPMEGALHEVKVYSRVAADTEIAEIVQRNQGLLSYRLPINQELQFVVKPYLQQASSTGITVMAETTAPSVISVEYAELKPLTNRVAATRNAAISEVSITDLKPFTRYFYRVTCTDAQGNMAQSEIASFQTAPGDQQAWAFGILGDTQRNPEVTRRCAEGLFALRPNMLLHVGDVVDDGYAKQQWVYDLFEPCANLLSYVPMFPVIGNHEKNAHWYYDYFSMPEPEYYYTFKFGNAQFFMIDSNKDLGPDSEQYRWLERELAKSTAIWKFTAHHHPCFSSDENDYGDHWKGPAGTTYTWGDTDAQKLIPLYEKYGVDIAFAGHIHSYERTWPILQMNINQKSGVRYVISGGGGGGLEQAAPQRSWFTIHVQRGHHYCLAAVHDRTIQFKAYDLEGRLFDTFELTKD